MQLLLIVIFFAFSCCVSCFAQEASLKAKTIDGSNVRGEKSVIHAKGNVEMKNEEIQINSEEIIIHKETKQITLPVEAKIVYSGLENEMTIFSKTLDGNPETKNVEATGIKTLSDMISYQVEKLKMIQPVVTFEKIKFSTCQMFELDKTDARKTTECSVPWNGYASKLVYNTETKQLKASNMFINLHGVPIFYTPYLSVNMNAKKDGFQQFNLVNVGGQQGLTFLYIKKDTKYGDFIIQPELYLSQDTSNSSIRAHNIKLTNEYESGAFQTKTDFKTTLLQTNTPENTGLDSGRKNFRYYLLNNNKYYNESSSTNVDLQLSSDRFVMQVYDMKYNNYLISNFNYNNYVNNAEKNRFYNADATYYKAMTSENQDTIPSFVSSTTYKTMLSKQNSKVQVSSNSEIMNFQRIAGTSGTRANTALEVNKLFKFKGFEAETKPSLNLYHYTYRNSQDSNLDFAYRVVGDVNTTISQSFSYNIKNYITQIKPMIFLDYTNDQTHGTVINEDSATSFVTDANIFTMSKYNGVDVIDSGLKGAYGLNVQMQNKQNRKFSFFAGQRYNTESGFSNYVGRANASLSKIQMSSKFIVQSDQAQILLSNSSISIQPFPFVTAGLGYFYLDKSLQNQTANLLSGQPIVTTENITYSGSLNYKNHSIFANIVQNPKFFSGNNTKSQNIITQISGGIGYSSNCLKYKLGAQNQLFFNGTTNMSVTSFIFEISMTS
jgi:lipopolysaccharide assembly outer membrane protein LptD (OstA)